MHHPVPNRHGAFAAEQPDDSLQQFSRGRVVVEALCRPASFEHDVARMVADGEAGLYAYALDLPPEPCGAILRGIVDGELDAGRAGVQDRNGSLHHGHQATMFAPPST